MLTVSYYSVECYMYIYSSENTFNQYQFVNVGQILISPYW